MHLSPFDDLNKGALSRRESPARRIGVIVSFLFLTSLGTVATLTSLRAEGHEQVDARVAVPALSATR